MTRRQKRRIRNIFVDILTYMTIVLIFLAGAFIAYLVIDVTGFMTWIISGQVEPEGFYFGKLTAEVLRLII
jgi:hypothetical protein